MHLLVIRILFANLAAFQHPPAVVALLVAVVEDLPAVVGEGMCLFDPWWVSKHANIEYSGRGGGRGGAKGGPKGAKGGKKVIVEPHRHKGVFVARGGKEDLLATANLVPGESVYGEKRISVENAAKGDDAATTKTEYRVSPHTFKLIASQDASKL